ncbi:MAG: hypothetical protein M3Q44_05755 [bacterium]|nr:hypothetical protein [bacterium]
MNTVDHQITDDEQNYYDTLTRQNTHPRNPFNWVPLLLIPLFFVIGWVAKGAYDVPNNSINNPQYGVGGGPGNITPYPSGYQVSPTPVVQPVTTIIEPTLFPSIDSEVQDTPSTSPPPAVE